MQNYTFHSEIEDLLTQFLQAFDGAIVKRYDNQGNVGNNIAVRYVYAPKQRVLFDLVDKAQHATLPAVAFSIASVERDNTRVFNKLFGQYWVDNTTSQYNSESSNQILQPVPINITVNVSILTRFQTDMDQILSNFVPYSDPYFIISWTREGMPGLEIRTEVLWSGTNNLTYPVEQQDSQPTRMICDTSFIIKGWLFKADANPVGRIFKIDSNFYAVSGVPTLQNIQYLTNPQYTESFVISAAPQIPYSSRWITPIKQALNLDLFGSELQYTNYVYLSGNNGMFGPTTTFNPFVSSTGMSSYPALTGVVPALSYNIISDNKLQVNYPAPSATGFFDIIVANDAGYTFLTKSAYNTNLSTQYPYISGVQVITP